LRDAAVDPAGDGFVPQSVGIPVIRRSARTAKLRQSEPALAGAGVVRGDGVEKTCAVIDAQHASIELEGELKVICAARRVRVDRAERGRTGTIDPLVNSAITGAFRARARAAVARKLTLVYDLRAINPPRRFQRS